MKKRKLLSMLITCMLIVSMLPLSAFAAMGDTPVKETESNNTMETANVIANGETAGGALTNSKQERDPVDYWAVTLDTKSSLRVTFTSESSSLTALILNGEGEKLAEVAGKLSPGIGKEELETGNLKTAEVELAAGTYYIAVGDTKTGALTSIKYVFYVETEHVHTWEQTGKDILRMEAHFKCTECDETKKEPLTEVSETELNDGAQWAVEATFEDVYYGDVENSEASSDLEDWYKITVDGKSKITVDACSASALLKLSLLDESENMLKEGADDRFGITGRGYIYSMAEIVPAGTYYVVVGLTEETERTEYHLGITATSVEKPEEVYRLSGSDRFLTGFAVAEEYKKLLGDDEFETVIVATGYGYADALSGSYLAVQKKAPILLADPNDVDTLVGYVKANLVKGGKVYILGGTGAVPAKVEEKLADHTEDICRLKGLDRFATNIEILKEAGIEGAEEILVATGGAYADSLSASAVNKPIMLVGGALTDVQKTMLDKLADDATVYILGGTAAVSEAVEAELAAYGTVDRVKGGNRFETSVAIAEKFFGEDVEAVTFAYGWNYPDGLCGGPVAAKAGAPVLLVHEGATDAAANYAAGVEAGYIFGGSGVISDATVRAVLGEDTVIVKR